MLKLKDLQKQFKEIIFNEKSSLLLSALDSNRSISASDSLEIYRQSIFTTLTETLQSVFVTVEALVGKEFFSVMAEAYIKQFPSLSGDLAHYGEKFSVFIADFEAVNHLPYLAEVAQLDWSYHEVFYEESPASFDWESLGAIREEEYQIIKFHLSPASRLLKFRFPIFRIWKFCQDDSDEKSIDLFSNTEQAEYLLVIRRNLEGYFEKITPGEFALLSAFKEGMLFEHACNNALKEEPNLDINACFQKHLLRGTLANFSINRRTENA